MRSPRNGVNPKLLTSTFKREDRAAKGIEEAMGKSSTGWRDTCHRPLRLWNRQKLGEAGEDPSLELLGMWP